MATILSHNLSTTKTNIVCLYEGAEQTDRFRIGNNYVGAGGENQIIRLKFTTGAEGARELSFVFSNCYWIPGYNTNNNKLYYKDGKVCDPGGYDLTNSFKFAITKNANTITPIKTSSDPGSLIEAMLASDCLATGTCTFTVNDAPNACADIGGACSAHLKPSTDYYLWLYGDYDMTTYLRCFGITGWGYACQATVDVTGNYESVITYDANGGTGCPSSQSTTPDVAITLSSLTPTRTGYTFQGWAVSRDFADQGLVSYSPGDTLLAESDITLYAVWKLNTYKITYNHNNFIVSSGMPDAQTKSHGEQIKLSTQIPTIEDTGVTGYRIKFDSQDGICNSDNITSNRIQHAEFLSWNTKKDGSGDTYNPGATYSADKAVTLYLQASTTYTNKSIALPTPDRAGYDFLGWSEDPSAKEGVTDFYTPVKDTTLYAIWRDQGQVHIDKGSDWQSYTVWIDDGTTWKQYVPYIDNGVSWIAYGHGMSTHEGCNHLPVLDIGTLNTCFETGLTSGFSCSICNKILVERLEIPATGQHNLDSGTVIQEPTYTNSGIREFKCQTEGCKYTETEIIPMLQHVHSYTDTLTVEPTCTEKGYTIKVCTCGEQSPDEEDYSDFVDATGHSFTYTTVTAATCTTPGSETGTCTCGATTTRDIAKLGHNTYVSSTTAATCQQEGSKTYKCSRCNYSYTQTIPKTSHSYTWEITKEATCAQTGERSGTCTVCGNTRTEEIPVTSNHLWDVRENGSEYCLGCGIAKK